MRATAWRDGLPRRLFLALVAISLAAGAAHADPLLRTGQKKCWNAAGTVVACAGTGQDGEQKKGARRAYVTNGNGTITDSVTGLTWEKLDDAGGIHDYDKTYSWAAAFSDKIAKLNQSPCYAGHCDWRLPNANELQDLVDYGRSLMAVHPAFTHPCPPGCSIGTCSCTDIDVYWTSTTYAYNDMAWVVDFVYGWSGAASKDELHSVRAVRGG